MNVRKQVVFPKNQSPNDKLINVILKNRKMTQKEAFDNLSSLQSAAFMKNVEKAAAEIIDARKKRRKVACYGDYDADGCGALLVAYHALKPLFGDNMVLYSNNRSMGFGMKKMGIDNILKMQPDTSLIITMDNGIVAFDEVEYARSLGIDVIITDHHIPDESGRLPNAVAVVNPHQDGETCEFKDLCGAGVIWKVMCLVYYKLGLSIKPLFELLDIVAMSTIADVVPLRGENRIIAKVGLNMMSQEVRPQWTSFKKLGSVYEPIINFTAKDVGFFIGPCVNACSRMNGNITEPLNAFMLTDKEEIHEAITHLTKVNEVRKTIQKGRVAEAMAYVSNCEDKFLVVAMEHCEEGVVGLVAGNVCNTSYRPTIVLSKDEAGNWKGSGRSIPGVHIKDILDVIHKSHPDILLAYGGHAQACGLTIKDGKVDEFRTLINEYTNNNFSDDVFVEKIIVDYVIDDATSLPMLYDEKVKLEPYGCDFPEPIVMMTFTPEETKVLKNGLHLIFKYKGIEIIAWNSGYHLNGRDPKAIKEVIAIGNIEKANTLNCRADILQIKF
jgi:single-stranded-DNA-specific exonuclease